MSAPRDEDNEEDRLLVESLLSNVEQTWERFVDETSGLVATIVRRLLRTHTGFASPADVDDITENVYVALMDNDAHLLRQFDPAHRLSTWLGVIARTQVHRHLRRLKPVASLGEEAGQVFADERNTPAGGDLIRGEARDAVRRALAALTDREQTVLRMFYFEDGNYNDIATALGVKVNSVGALLTRARARLQQELKNVTDLSESDYRAI